MLKPGPSKPIIGWDIGGAHLKAVLLDANGNVLNIKQLPCPLWRGLHELDSAHYHWRLVVPLLSVHHRCPNQ